MVLPLQHFLSIEKYKTKAVPLKNLNLSRLILISIFLVSCGNDRETSATAATSPLSSSFPAIGYKPFASGFNAPVAITNAHDGSNRLFIVEQSGTIKIINNGTVVASPFLNISSLVRSGGEQGLLGLAFPPNFSSKKYFYVDYTNNAGVGNTVIARYPLTSNANVADSAAGTTLLTITQPFANHNGGQLEFGPADGFLYIATGDGGSGGDPFNNAQSKSSLLGKILRIDVESGAQTYTIPTTNPFNNEVWAYGLRNPWRFSFDRVTRELYIADVGQNTTEEINVQPPGRGADNFGWKIMEGSHCFIGSTCNRSGLILPVSEYDHSEGDCSVTGGYVYRGNEFTELQGIYLYSDFCSGKLRALRKNGTTWESKVLIDTPFQISSFGEDEAGNLYFSDLGSGTIYKIVRP